jgi:hypothetical protein
MIEMDEGYFTVYLSESKKITGFLTELLPERNTWLLWLNLLLRKIQKLLRNQDSPGI